MNILLLNSGSSSLKFSVMSESGEVRASGSADWAGTTTHYRFNDRREVVSWRGPAETVRRLIADMNSEYNVSAVGHRWVHGGEFVEPTLIQSDTEQRLIELAQLAPLHNPVSLDAYRAAREHLPDVPHIAVFDTAFHATLPAEARTLAIPSAWRDWGIRRFGFHGLSYAYCSQRTAEMLNRDDLRIVICHLGQGCSAAAIRHGQCIDTTMGFTPLDGLVMATRCGSIDPGVILHVMRQRQLDVDEVDDALNHRSGLLGLSGISGDMRELLAASARGNMQARLALQVYMHRLRQTIGGLTASLGGLDALVFTGGVGEHSPEVRRDACTELQYLGIDLDPEQNDSAKTDSDIATVDSRVRVLVIATREDLIMLREVRKVMSLLPT